MNHLCDTNKMVDTPKTEAVNQYLRTRRDYTITDHEVWMRHSMELERELNAANDRIKRLEEAGDAMEVYCDAISAHNWNKAKEAKP